MYMHIKLHIHINRAYIAITMHSEFNSNLYSCYKTISFDHNYKRYKNSYIVAHSGESEVTTLGAVPFGPCSLSFIVSDCSMKCNTIELASPILNCGKNERPHDMDRAFGVILFSDVCSMTRQKSSTSFTSISSSCLLTDSSISLGRSFTS